MFCPKCGKEVFDDAVVCIHCGRAIAQNKTVSVFDAPNGQKNWLVTLLLCFFLGGIGAHRFYTGHTVLGIVYLLTLGFCGIGALIDLILILCGTYTDASGQPLAR
jgi:predicted RNA-binding Zn-ribbon protein involved in translation (DUF1610 family)